MVFYVKLILDKHMHMDGLYVEVNSVLQTLREHKLCAKFGKSKIWLEKVCISSHVISKVGISVDPVRIETVIKWERLKNLIEIRSSGLSWVLKVVC